MSKLKNILYTFTFLTSMLTAIGEEKVNVHTTTRAETLIAGGWVERVLNLGNLKPCKLPPVCASPFEPELAKASKQMVVTAEVLSKAIDDDNLSDFVIGSPMIGFNVSGGSEILSILFNAAGECSIRNEAGHYVMLLSGVSYGKNSVQIKIHSKPGADPAADQLLEEFWGRATNSMHIFLRTITWNETDPKIKVLGKNWNSLIANCSSPVSAAHFQAVTYLPPSGMTMFDFVSGQKFADGITSIHLDPDASGTVIASLGGFKDPDSPNDFSVNAMLRAMVLSLFVSPSGKRFCTERTIFGLMCLLPELKKLPGFAGVVDLNSPKYPRSSIEPLHLAASENAYERLHNAVKVCPIGTRFFIGDIFPEL